MNLAVPIAGIALAVTTALGAVPAGAAPSAPAATAAAAPKPPIVWNPIPFSAQRRADTRAYSVRHYGTKTFQLKDPKVIVEHFTDGPSWQSAWNTFAPNVADGELGEKPGTCAHFVVDERGVIHQLVSIATMCRHTVGLNWTAIGIEHVGYSDADVLGNPKQLQASIALTCWLRGREGIAVKNVIGHNESLSSPYHRERVERLKTQTHDDFRRASMQTYRAKLKQACG